MVLCTFHHHVHLVESISVGTGHLTPCTGGTILFSDTSDTFAIISLSLFLDDGIEVTPSFDTTNTPSFLDLRDIAPSLCWFKSKCPCLDTCPSSMPGNTDSSHLACLYSLKIKNQEVDLSKCAKRMPSGNEKAIKDCGTNHPPSRSR